MTDWIEFGPHAPWVIDSIEFNSFFLIYFFIYYMIKMMLTKLNSNLKINTYLR